MAKTCTFSHSNSRNNWTPPAALREALLVAALTPELIEEFPAGQARRGIGSASLEVYRWNGKKLLEFLPEDKRITPETGRIWKRRMEAQGALFPERQQLSFSIEQSERVPWPPGPDFPEGLVPSTDRHSCPC